MPYLQCIWTCVYITRTCPTRWYLVRKQCTFSAAFGRMCNGVQHLRPVQKCYGSLCSALTCLSHPRNVARSTAACVLSMQRRNHGDVVPYNRLCVYFFFRKPHRSLRLDASKESTRTGRVPSESYRDWYSVLYYRMQAIADGRSCFSLQHCAFFVFCFFLAFAFAFALLWSLLWCTEFHVTDANLLIFVATLRFGTVIQLHSLQYSLIFSAPLSDAGLGDRGWAVVFFIASIVRFRFPVG